MELSSSERFKSNFEDLILVFLEIMPDAGFKSLLNKAYIGVCAVKSKVLIENFMLHTHRFWHDMYTKDIQFFVGNVYSILCIDYDSENDDSEDEEPTINGMVYSLNSKRCVKEGKKLFIRLLAEDSTLEETIIDYAKSLIKISLRYSIESEWSPPNFDTKSFMKHHKIAFSISSR